MRVVSHRHACGADSLGVIRDPQGKFDTQALLCTRLEVAPVQVLQWFGRRWQVEVTFSDTLAMGRRWLWADQHFQLSQTQTDMIKGPRSFFERLTETLCYAA